MERLEKFVCSVVKELTDTIECPKCKKQVSTIYNFAGEGENTRSCYECHEKAGILEIKNNNNNNINSTDLVRHEYTLTYTCECSYYIGQEYEGIRFCPYHSSIVSGIKKLLKNQEL